MNTVAIKGSLLRDVRKAIGLTKKQTAGILEITLQELEEKEKSDKTFVKEDKLDILTGRWPGKETNATRGPEGVIVNPPTHWRVQHDKELMELLKTKIISKAVSLVSEITQTATADVTELSNDKLRDLISVLAGDGSCETVRYIKEIDGFIVSRGTIISSFAVEKLLIEVLETATFKDICDIYVFIFDLYKQSDEAVFCFMKDRQAYRQAFVAPHPQELPYRALGHPGYCYKEKEEV